MTTTPLTIEQAFALPRREEIAALGFVVRLEEQQSDARDRKLVEEYVLTPGVQVELPRIFDKLRRSIDRGEDLGWFIHGSFGSGKSHLMSLMGLLLEDQGFAWAKPHPTIAQLAQEHRGWIAEQRPLVVRLHMLTSGDRHGAGLDRAVYRAANKALERAGLPAFSFFDLDAVFDEIRHEAALYGAKLWQNMISVGLIESQAHYDDIVAGTVEEREEFAKLYITEYKRRALESAGFQVNWAEGLQRLAAHVQRVGRRALVLLIDEFLLWLSEKSGPEFRQAINDLNTVVDHSDGKRAVPVAVFVARQRNITEFFPDLVQEKDLYEHLDHHAQRFELTTLQDVELRHICRERVLKRREEAAIEEALGQLTSRHAKVLGEVMHSADAAYLRDVYPFHPALIEALIDISSLMQRERTALRLLYELLIVHHPNLRLGELLPVGSAFEAIFPPAGVEGSKRIDDLRSIHSFYWQRVRPALDELYADPSAAPRRVLDQLIKTALLAKISPRLRGGGEGMALERLILLNDADVEGFSEKGKLLKAYQSLQQLAQRVPDVLIHGSGSAASIDIVLHGVNFGEVLERARREVDHVNRRFATFHRVFKAMMGLEQATGFKEQGATNEGARSVRWRGTQREGTVALLNVREAQHKRFATGASAWRLLIDYPWDEPGYNVEHDRLQIDKARKSMGAQYTLCWLPAHFTAEELKVLLDLAATLHLQEPHGQDQLLGMLGQADRQRVVEQARTMSKNLEEQLYEIMRRVYQDAGEVKALVDGVTSAVPHRELHKNIDYFAGVLLDRRAPNHPHLKAEPTPKALNVLLDWMVEAMEQSSRQAAFDAAQASALTELGEPLELVTMGQSRATLRLDTRYIKVVWQHATGQRFLWSKLDEALVEQFGLTPEVRNLFLMFLVRGHSYRLLQPVTGEVIAPPEGVDGKTRAEVQLEPAPVLQLAQWSQARELAQALFPKVAQRHAAQRTVSHQDAWLKELREHAQHAREALLSVRESLRALRIPDEATRVKQTERAMARLEPLLHARTDSFASLMEWLARWESAEAEAERLVVARADDQRAALALLSQTKTTNMLQINAAHSPEAEAQRGALHDRLSAAEAASALSTTEIKRWLAVAEEINERILRQIAQAQQQEAATRRDAEQRIAEAERAAREAERAAKESERQAKEAERRAIEATRKADEALKSQPAAKPPTPQPEAATQRDALASAAPPAQARITRTQRASEVGGLDELLAELKRALAGMGESQVVIEVIVRGEER